MYTLYHADDTQVLQYPAGTKEKNEFVFTGFGNGIHPYYRTQYRWLKEMLKSAGVELNIINVPTVDDIGANADNGQFEVKDLNFYKEGTYLETTGFCLIQDVEMGRGWAVLLQFIGATPTIVMQEHRDTVRDTMLSEKWLKKQGVEVQFKKVKNIDKLK